MGLRAVTLGHGYAPVVDAVREVLSRGVSFTRPTRLELEAAEDFVSVVTGADMVKFAKNGSDATTAALKLARAATGRDMVAVASQPFFSTDDWFIGTTGDDGAASRARSAPTTVRFTYNDLDSLRALFARVPGPHRRGVHRGRDGDSSPRRPASSRGCASCAPPRAPCWCSTR